MSLIEIKKKLLMAQKGGADVSELFNTSLWTGTSAARTITTGIDSGEGSLVWIKSRSFTDSNFFFDTTRGAGNYIFSDLNIGQNFDAQVLTSFLSTGYALGTSGSINLSGQGFVGWQFRRAEKFFDIVQYTGNGASGRAIAHDVGIKPGMMVIKRLDATQNWAVYHQARTATEYAGLNLTNAFASSSGFWNNTEPTSTNFTVGNSALVNASGGTYIAYLFAHDTAVDGFIQCGSYTGNGSSTGPVVNLGWRPQYLMIKKATGTAADWQVLDAVRGMSAGNDPRLLPNLPDVELTNLDVLDTTSTGFQIKTTSGIVNTNTNIYVYMAIREA